MYAEFSTKETFPQAEGNAVEVGTAMRYVFAGTIILSSSMLFHLSNYLHQDRSGPEMLLLFLYIQDCLSRKRLPVILNEQAISSPCRMIGWLDEHIVFEAGFVPQLLTLIL